MNIIFYIFTIFVALCWSGSVIITIHHAKEQNMGSMALCVILDVLLIPLCLICLFEAELG
jgi:hypothetical protein